MEESLLSKDKDKELLFISSKPKFSMTCDEFISDNGERYIAYGIMARSARGALLDEVKDVTVNRKELLQLISKLNKMNVSVIHLRDIVDDFLSAC